MVALLGIGAGLLIDGGGGGGETTTTVVQTDTPTDEAPETTTTDGETTTTDGETTTETDTTTTDTTSPLATVEATVATIPVRVELTELARQGTYATLNFTVTNLSGRDSDIFFENAFDDTGNGTAADGLLMIDPADGTQYGVVRNAEEGCLCSDEVPFRLEAHDSTSLFATFEAPSESTSQVNITFPGSLGTITDVPISG